LNNEKYIYNIVFVNDGSIDKTYESIISARKKLEDTVSAKNVNISILSFDKNYGHEAAMCAGLYNSNADYLIFLDADLQNPPNKVPEILDKFERGADCVLMQRVRYLSASLLKKITSKGYYLFSKLVLRNKNYKDVSDFFAFNKSVAQNVKNKYHTTLRFIRSFVQNESKNIKIVEYESGKRFSGTTRYNYMTLLKLAAISELSRIKFLRDRCKPSLKNPIYILDKNKSQYFGSADNMLIDGV
jgi:dolichol-phosphate mannosyltransferase